MNIVDIQFLSPNRLQWNHTNGPPNIALLLQADPQLPTRNTKQPLTPQTNYAYLGDSKQFTNQPTLDEEIYSLETRE